MANLGVAVNHRRRSEDGDWVDDGATFYPVAVWGEHAENVAVSLISGARVVVLGHIRSRSFETQAGERRTRFEVLTDEIAPSLRWATVTLTRTHSGPDAGDSHRRDHDSHRRDHKDEPAG